MKLRHAFSGGLRSGLPPLAVGPALRTFFLCLLCSVAAADTITWTPPSTYVNGAPMPPSKLSGGYVQVDDCKGKVEMILPYHNTTTLGGIYPAPGLHCWSVAVTTVDGGFNISAPVLHTDACQIGQPCDRTCH
jgi:hypothetical protein